MTSGDWGDQGPHPVIGHVGRRGQSTQSTVSFFPTVMPIAYLTLELRIEGAHSLKDKRQVVRSLKDRLRNSFNIAIAEIEVTDLWQRATLAAVSISDSRDYLDGLMRNVEREAVRLANNAGAEVVDSFVDFVEIGESGNQDIG
jgi:uncharacterized protein